MGLPQNALKNYENGLRNNMPSPLVILGISRLYNLNYDFVEKKAEEYANRKRKKGNITYAEFLSSVSNDKG